MSLMQVGACARVPALSALEVSLMDLVYQTKTKVLIRCDDG